jgi:GTP-binding protein EngB required for normal cell division
MPDAPANSLNSSHQRRLSVTCRHVDKLLADMESALNISASKVAFPQYALDISPGQRRIIEDYISRIRAQLVRVLDGQGIERPAPDIPVSRALHVNLTFVDLAAEELNPEYMRGYGEISPGAAVELNGIAAELKSLARQLDQYLTRGSRENLQERLERLEQTGDEVSLLRRLESIITEHGLVEFRSTLAMIIDRLEDNRFEIAVLGRVSSGKSSLLNTILEANVLPVGVTPITAVPTRLVYGESPSVRVWRANRTPEEIDISQLQEFVAEQLNRGNEKHVTRIVVQLPSSRLREGMAFVDTPGLGSLATRGAAETLAYLPRCDLGVVLIDAGSTLTPDDLQTIQILYQAAIPATVLLSKADLLTPEDRLRVIGYVKEHIKEQLNLDLAVHAVSVTRGSQDLLTRWFEDDIAPLYGQRQELKIRSIRRKLGGLQQSVEMALRTRLRSKGQLSPLKVEQLRVLEAELRRASGRLEEMRKGARNLANELEFAAARILRLAAETLVESWWKQGANDGEVPQIVRGAVVGSVQKQTDSLRCRIDTMSHKLHETLRATAKMLEVEDAPAEQEFSALVREMPAFDLGAMDVRLRRPVLVSLLGTNLSTSVVAKRLNSRMGDQLAKALSAYHALLNDWSERTFSQIQRRFDAYGDSYRAQIQRLLGDNAQSAGQESAIRPDLEGLENASRGPTAGSEGVPRPRMRGHYEEERKKTAC